MKIKCCGNCINKKTKGSYYECKKKSDCHGMLHHLKDIVLGSKCEFWDSGKEEVKFT